MKNFVLFPSDPLTGSIGRVDDDFRSEHDAAIRAGFKTLLFDHDKLVKTGEVVLSEVPSNGKVVLRGWMLTLSQYTALHKKITEAGCDMVTSPSDYEKRHYWPKAYESYPVLRAMSPACIWTEGDAFSVKQVKEFFRGRPIIVKDHVKSAKGADDAMFIKNSGDKREVWSVVRNMLNERGPLFERGIVFKEKLNIKKDDNGNPIEVRIFFNNGRKLSFGTNGCKYPALFVLDEKKADIVREMGDGFYVIDAALCEDGTWKVLECGDGQVSGLMPDMDMLRFYFALKKDMSVGQLNENPLTDDYPVYLDYLYVVDGKVIRSFLQGTVGMLKKELRKDGLEANEVTSCDISGRGMF